MSRWAHTSTRLLADLAAAALGLACFLALIYGMAASIHWRPGPNLDEAPIARRRS